MKKNLRFKKNIYSPPKIFDYLLKNTIMVLNIDNSNFEALVEGDKLVVIDFWAQWCGPCIKMGEIIEEVAKDYEGKAIIGKCDIENNNELVVQFQVRSIPTLVFLKGEKAEIHVGPMRKPDLVAKIEQFL